jgi:hypothetical protein
MFDACWTISLWAFKSYKCHLRAKGHKKLHDGLRFFTKATEPIDRD